MEQTGMVRVSVPGEVDPCLADFPRKSHGRRSSACLPDTESGIVEYISYLAGMVSAGLAVQRRRPPAKNVAVGGCAAQSGLALSLRHMNLAPGRDGNGAPK